jgi:hypothetical protein
MEQLAPQTFARRKEEDAEDAEEEEKTCRGGFTPWQTIAAAQDISFGNMVGVSQGTPGIIICNSTDGHHLTVKFEYREDASELCVDVLPGHLMLPLPGNFRINQKVMACIDLHHSGNVLIRVGTPGVVCGPAPHISDHLHVRFEDRIDAVEAPEGFLAVHHSMILPYRLLVGGFSLGQRIQSNRDIIINDQLFVTIGTPGVIIGEYSDTRLTVAFETTENQNQEQGYDSHSNFNVLPPDIRVYRETPCDMPLGQIVRAKTDLGSGRSLLVKVGTRGTVIAYIDEWRIIVSFEANEEDGTCQQVLTVTEGALEKVDLEGTTGTDCFGKEQA